MTKRGGWNRNYNASGEHMYRILLCDNLLLFMQYYNGYGEGLLAFEEFHSMLRVGICIKPRLFTEY